MRLDCESGPKHHRVCLPAYGASDLRSTRFFWIAAFDRPHVAIAAGVWMIRSRYSRQPGRKDTVLIADFENSTGEPVFDGALKQGLAVGLGQSPYLEIVGNDRVLEALRFMGRSPAERVVPPLAPRGLSTPSGEPSGFWLYFAYRSEVCTRCSGGGLRRRPDFGPRAGRR